MGAARDDDPGALTRSRTLAQREDSRGYGPKEWLPFLGEPLLVRTARLLAACTDPVLVVARGRDQALPPLPAGVGLLLDAEPDLGPLPAIAAGLRALAAAPRPPTHVFVTGCDAPFVSARAVAGLAGSAGDAELVLPVVGGVPQPLAALWSLRALSAVEALLAEGCRTVRAVAERVSTRRLDEAALRAFDPALAFLRNVNTPDDYRRALADAQRAPPR